MKICQKPKKDPKQGQLCINNNKVQLILGQYNDISSKFQDIIINKDVFSRKNLEKSKRKNKNINRIFKYQSMKDQSFSSNMISYGSEQMMEFRYSLFQLSFLVKKQIQNNELLDRQEIFSLIFSKIASDLKSFANNKKEDLCIKLKRRICEVIRVLIGANIVYINNGCFSATDNGKRKGLAYIKVLKEKKRMISAAQSKIISLQQEKAKLIEAIEMIRILKQKNKDGLIKNSKQSHYEQSQMDERLYYPWKIVGETKKNGIFDLNQKFVICNYIDILSLLRKRQPSLAKK